MTTTRVGQSGGRVGRALEASGRARRALEASGRRAGIGGVGRASEAGVGGVGPPRPRDDTTLRMDNG